jgi:hypothetical protein
MCFKNLPIEFDADGKAHLIPGVADPYKYGRCRSRSATAS